jgi:hypothetical protein
MPALIFALTNKCSREKQIRKNLTRKIQKTIYQVVSYFRFISFINSI